MLSAFFLFRPSFETGFALLRTQKDSEIRAWPPLAEFGRFLAILRHVLLRFDVFL